MINELKTCPEPTNAPTKQGYYKSGYFSSVT